MGPDHWRSGSQLFLETPFFHKLPEFLMATPPPARPPAPPTSRAEKMSILSAMLGPQALARLREGQADTAGRSSDPVVPIDSERAAWHRNRLLERLRNQGGGVVTPESPILENAPLPGSAASTPRPADSPQDRSFRRSLDLRLSAIADLESLGDEHPAVITRLLSSLSRQERVAVLKSLPGPVARSVLKRLR